MRVIEQYEFVKIEGTVAEWREAATRHNGVYDRVYSRLNIEARNVSDDHILKFSFHLKPGRSEGFITRLCGNTVPQ